jgi:hypothetical protein
VICLVKIRPPLRLGVLRKEGESPNLSASFISLRVEKEHKKTSEGTNVSP